MEPINRAQLQYPLDAESLATLKAGLPTPLKELQRVQAITLLTGQTTFDVRNTDVMSVTGNAAVTIATITNGYSGQVLSLLFNDANVTITDTASGATGTINLNGAFTSSTNAILQLLHDGTSWREIDRTSADVGGPATSTDNAIARWDGTTGQLLQDSTVTVSDTGVFTGMRLADGGFIGDPDGNEALVLDTVVSAINYVYITNASIGTSPTIGTAGDDTNVAMFFQTKGAGDYIFQGNSTQPAIVTLREDTDNGTNGISLTVSAALSGNFTLTLPADTGNLVADISVATLTNKTLTSSTNVLGGVTMTLGSDADGDIYYRSSNVLTRLAKGTALQQLRINAGATAPEWATISSAVTQKNNVTTRGGTASSGNQTIAHGLGSTPTKVTIRAYFMANTGANTLSISDGEYNGTTTSCIWANDSFASGSGNSATNIIEIYFTSTSNSQKATVTVDGTNITLAWTLAGTMNAADINILWAVQ